MNKSRLPSTIVMGIFLLLLVFPVILLASFNLNQAMADLADQASQGSSGNAHDGVGVAIVAMFGSLGLLLYATGLIIITFVPCFVMIFFAIRNIKVQEKPIKVLNIVYTSLIGAIMVLDIVKLILFVTGVA